MEIASKPQDRENPSPTNSPNSNGSCSNSNGSLQIPTPPVTPKPVSRSEVNPYPTTFVQADTATSPKPVSRSEVNPYPTTFVQADTATFKQVVQMLTGSSETAQQTSKVAPSDPVHPATTSATSNKGSSIPPIKTGQKKQGFKLYERRNSLKNGLMISPLVPGFHPNSSFSPRKPEILTPSILDFPSLVLSPITPLNEDTFNKFSPLMGNSSEEEKAIAEKKFYLHPSPRTTPRDSEPQLLTLFPLTSPRVSGSTS